MKQMICYLYEFHHNQKVRNVGFVRVIPYADKVVLQFHGKGMGFQGVEDFEVFLFSMKDDICYVTSIGHMDGVHGNMNSMIEVTGSDVTEGEGLEQFDGIVIRQAGGQNYVAAWKNIDVNVEHMREMSKEEESSEETGNEEANSGYEESEILPVKIKEEEREVHRQEVKEKQRKEEQEAELQEVGTVQQETEEEESEVILQAVKMEEVDVIPQEMKEEQRKEETEVISQEEGYPRYEKIERQDIARLPRKEWKLANNSFLLHGFYNYKHLLFIEEKEQLYLGVPGVYHKRENEAANAFGFGQFHRAEKELPLSEDERNDADDFGYWCRPVEQLEPRIE